MSVTVAAVVESFVCVRRGTKPEGGFWITVFLNGKKFRTTWAGKMAIVRNAAQGFSRRYGDFDSELPVIWPK